MERLASLATIRGISLDYIGQTELSDVIADHNRLSQIEQAIAVLVVRVEIVRSIWLELEPWAVL